MAKPWIGPIKDNHEEDVTFMIKEYPLPEGIDAYILKGIKKGKGIKRTKAAAKAAGIAAVVLLTMFLGAVKVSPVFASYAENIPGLQYIARLITDDKGLQSAVDNEFIQKVDKSEEADKLVFTVKDIIADNANLIVFYSIENKGGYKWPGISKPEILDANGNKLKLSVSFGTAPTEDKVFEGKITFSLFNEKGKPPFVLPDNIIISTKIAVSKDSWNDNTEKTQSVQQARDSILEAPKDDLNVLAHEYRIPVTIDKSKFANTERNYALHQTIEVEGQKITFDNVKVCPTRMEIELAFAPENTMKIFSFEDLKVIDEQGREWSSSNSVNAVLTDDNHRTLFFQSNYFTSPKKLYITGNSIRALDKSALQVQVDLKNKKFIKTPDDKLVLSDIKLDDRKIAISHTLKNPSKGLCYNVFNSDGTDAGTNKLTRKESMVFSPNAKGIQESYDVFEGTSKITGPVTLTIYDYPNWIKGSFRVDIIK